MSAAPRSSTEVSAEELDAALRGSIPMAIATVSLDGVVNVTYMSRVRRIDEHRLALSNQFLGKTRANLAENPVASLLAIEPTNYAQYRIDVTFERSERSGPIFDVLAGDVATLAALGGSTAHFELRSADVFRIVNVARVHPVQPSRRDRFAVALGGEGTADVLAQIADVGGRTDDVDGVLAALGRVLARAPVPHTPIVATWQGRRIRPLSSTGVGEDVATTDPAWDVLEVAAVRAESLLLDNLVLSSRYARSIVTDASDPAFEGAGTPTSATSRRTKSLVAAPIVDRAVVLGVVALVSPSVAAFDRSDLAFLRVLARLLAPHLLADDEPVESSTVEPSDGRMLIRLYPDDASVFVDDEYVTRGLAGEVLAHLLRVHAATGRTAFTNRELRVAPQLDIPGLRENLESRLLELQRRLATKRLPLRIERTARGRFTFDVQRPFTLDRPRGHR